jgi:hypothetical protein
MEENITLISIELKDKETLDLLFQIGKERKRYVVPFFVNELHAFDFPEEFRRILRVQPSPTVSRRLMNALSNFINNKPVKLPLLLNDVVEDKREAA